MKNEDVVHIEVNSSDGHVDRGSFKVESFLGIYDGHGGDAAALYAKDHFVPYLNSFGRNNFDLGLSQIIKKGVKKFDGELTKYLMNPSRYDNSGSCALFLVQVGRKVCVASVGDSKAIICRQVLSEVECLTTPHKPENKTESDRISSAGGYIYRNQSGEIRVKGALAQLIALPKKQPLRVFPSNLSITRAFGNGVVKTSHSTIIISDPEVVEIEDEFLYMIMASDGVYDSLSDSELACIVEDVLLQGIFTDIQQASDMVVSVIFQKLIANYCCDNISLVFVAGSLLESLLQE